jgi:hypothetical protein
MKQRLGSNINIGTRNRLDVIAKGLVSDASMPGRDLALTTARSGITRSVFNPSVDIAANTADISAQYEIMVRNGAENIVSDDVDTWTKDNVTVSTSTEEYTLTDDATDARHQTIFASSSPTDNENQAFCLDAKAGTMETMGLVIRAKSGVFATAVIDLTDASIVSSSFDGLTATLRGEWVSITAYHNISTGATTPAFYIRMKDNTTYTGNGDSMTIRNVRVVKDSDVCHPGFEIASAAAEVYGADLVSCTIPSGLKSLYISRKSYGGWTNNDCPSTATPVIFKSGTFEVRVNASGFIETSGGAISTKKTDGTRQRIYVNADGANHTIQVGDETPVVNASAISIPAGTANIGNNGTLADHSSAVYQLSIDTYNDTGLAALDSYYQPRLTEVLY